MDNTVTLVNYYQKHINEGVEGQTQHHFQLSGSEGMLEEIAKELEQLHFRNVTLTANNGYATLDFEKSAPSSDEPRHFGRSLSRSLQGMTPKVDHTTFEDEILAEPATTFPLSDFLAYCISRYARTGSAVRLPHLVINTCGREFVVDETYGCKANGEKPNRHVVEWAFALADAVVRNAEVLNITPGDGSLNLESQDPLTEVRLRKEPLSPALCGFTVHMSDGADAPQATAAENRAVERISQVFGVTAKIVPEITLGHRSRQTGSFVEALDKTNPPGDGKPAGQNPERTRSP